MKELFILFLIGIQALSVYSDGPCAPKQAHLTLGDSYFSNFEGDNGNRDQAGGQDNPGDQDYGQGQNDGIGHDIAKIVWVTLDACNDSYLTVSKTNPPSQFRTYMPRTEYYSQYINTSFLGVHIEGQYTRYSKIVELNDLEPDTFYTAFLISSDGSTSFNFKIPHPYRPNNPLNILFYADIDYSNVSMPTISRLQSMLSNESSDYNLTIFGGDLVYEIVQDVGNKGDVFFENFQDLWTTRPMLLTPGNHEYYYNFSLLNYRVKMPLYNQTGNHYYSWNVGYVHFLSFNYDFYDYVDSASQETMYKWVERDLMIANSTKNRMKRPWIIVYTHRPIYCSQNCYNLYNKRKIWDDLMSKYQVDLYLSGHVHNYERMGAIANNRSCPYQSLTDPSEVEVILNPSAPIYIIDGSAGEDYAMPTEPYPGCEYSILVDINIGFSTLTIYNASVIGWKHIKSDDGSVIDQFYLRRDRPLPPGGNFDPIVTGMFILLLIASAHAYYRKKSLPTRSALSEPIMKKKEEIPLSDINNNQIQAP